ncbi:MAG: ABC transporter permease [Tetragenococcus halophilus]|nr:ABC transporter permease [Tetragenococcus halophilus]
MLENKGESWIKKLSVPILAVLFGFLTGALIMLAFGYNPIDAYSHMILDVFSNPYSIGEALTQATLLIFTGLAFDVASKAGFFNIGIAGQFLFGWLATITFALQFPDLPRIILVTASLIVGTLAGAFYAAIAGFLRAYFGTSEVIVTIMLNHTMMRISNYVTNFVIGSGSRTEKVSENASLALGWLTNLTNFSRLNMGLFIAVAVVFIYSIFMKHTTAGYEIKAVGLNPDAATYAGMSAKKNIILSMVISGGLAGLGGAINGLGTFGNIFVVGNLPSEGFNGIAVALLGLGNPIGIVLSSVLFGVLKTGSSFMSSRAGVPDEMSQIVIASIVFFVGSYYLIEWIMNKFSSKRKKSAVQTDTEGGVK